MNHLRLLILCVLVGAAAWPAAGHRIVAADFAVRQEPDRVLITDGGRPVANYVFRDDTILRPFFANVHAPGGIQVTRHHPPVANVDATDHDAMHPGVWLAFGDLSGHDFWRNKARIVHDRFVETPAVRDGQVSFTTQNTFETASGEEVCRQTSRLTLAARPAGYLLTWEATFTSDRHDFVFGDQEEMGLGVRMATAVTENSGGTVRNSEDSPGARATWGRTAAWSDYSGTIDQRRVGVLLMPAPDNFRVSWFHNRDYGLMVANPFGRNAFTGGQKSAVVVKKGESFRLRFGILIHSAAPGQDVDPDAEYEHFKRTLTP